MKKNIIYVVITLLMSLVFFFELANFYSFTAYPYLVLLLGGAGVDILSQTWLIITSLVAIILLFATNVWQLLHLRFKKTFLKVQTLLYLVALLFVIMLKSRGVQGINLNPLNLLTQFQESAFIVFANIVLFIPVGFLLFRRVKTLKMVVASATIGLIILEISQYLLHLGIADVADILTNLSGILLGYLGLDLLRDLGWKSRTDSSYIYFYKN
ncbi:VanZ family protein [Streptococcus sp. E17BB]|uniref:VanZ family protein n=1 Tax=Streptococcus sp. E17BB TaxID=3278714 RepID=UPI00359D2346